MFNKMIEICVTYFAQVVCFFLGLHMETVTGCDGSLLSENSGLATTSEVVVKLSLHFQRP